MNFLRKIFLFLLLVFSINIESLSSMRRINSIEELNESFKNLSLSDSESSDSEYEDEYDSDSEDEEVYEYEGLIHFDIPEKFHGKKCIVLIRGIHFARSYFDKEKRSKLKRTSEIGKTIYSSAVYDSLNFPLGKIDFEERNLEKFKKKASDVTKSITSLESRKRNKFQELYTNYYDKFHSELEEPSEENKDIFLSFDFKKNPQVSFSEDFLHPLKYSLGLKFLGKKVKKLKPEYDEFGNPKHPYLGKMYVAIIPINKVKKIYPYFVVSSYAKNKIFVSTHYTRNILSEREVSIPGFIKGKYIVYDKEIRVPSFAWEEYQDYYKEKYDISKRSFKTFQTKLKNGTFKDSNIIKKVMKYYSNKLSEHVTKICEENDITVFYKSLDVGYIESLPDLEEAKEKIKKLKEKK
ncbi:hypothetical protein GF385_01705 [Candidatus Dependentiae bacterium]|nr:hypothetical protein [Candidatus Dependentiae bacterium]